MRRATRWTQMAALAAGALLLLGLPGCYLEFIAVSGDRDHHDVTVFESAGRRQCEAGGITPQQSALLLVDSGVDVLSSGCGVRTDLALVALCGTPTEDIVLHRIRRANLDEAQRLGFESVVQLRNGSSRGYEWIDCDTREVLR